MTDIWDLRLGDLVCRRPRYADDPEALEEAEVRGFTTTGLVRVCLRKRSGIQVETLVLPEDLQLLRSGWTPA